MADGGLTAGAEAPQAPGVEDGDAAGDTGRVIHNPVSGERIVIRRTGAQTGGELLAFDLYLPPGAHVPARHVHPIQEERFTVISGQMRFRLGRRSFVVGPGATVAIPRGVAHWFGNAGLGEAHARVEARPALRMEEMFEETEAIGVAASRQGSHLPRVTDLARLLLRYQREVAVPNAPAPLVRALLTSLVWLGGRRDGGSHGRG